MAQNDHLPLVFKFGEVDSEPEEIENKEEWGLMDMPQNELATAVTAPALVQVPIRVRALSRPICNSILKELEGPTKDRTAY